MGQPGFLNRTLKFKYGEDLEGNPALWYMLSLQPRREQKRRMHVAAQRVTMFVRKCAALNVTGGRGFGRHLASMANLAQKDQAARSLGGSSGGINDRDNVALAVAKKKKKVRRKKKKEEEKKEEDEEGDKAHES